MRPSTVLAGLLTALLVATQLGCGAGARRYFRGVERGFGDEIEPGDGASVAAAPAEAATTERAAPGLSPTTLQWDGLVGAPALHADGQRVVFQGVRPGDPPGNLWEQTFLLLPGRAPVRATAGVGKTHGAVFAPGEGLRLAFGATPRDGATPERAAPAVGDSADHAMDIYLLDLHTGATSVLAEGPGFDGEPSFCADGRFAFSSERTGDREIYGLDGPQAAPRRLTERAGADDAPRLAPDCAEVLYVARGPTTDALLAVPFAGGAARVVLAAAGRVAGLDWTPDGARVVFATDLGAVGAAPDLFSVARDGKDLRRVTDTPAAERHPRLTSDGLFVVLTVTEGETPRLARAPLPDLALCPPFPPLAAASAAP